MSISALDGAHDVAAESSSGRKALPRGVEGHGGAPCPCEISYPSLLLLCRLSATFFKPNASSVLLLGQPLALL
jgi:hypothetical protein